MALTTSANYDTYNALSSKESRVIITFDGIAGVKFASGDFSGITATYKQYIIDCQYNFAKIDPFNNSWESGGCTFRILDKDSVVTDFLYDNAIEELEVTIKHGFRQIVEGDFVTLPPVFVKSYRLLNDLMTYEFFCFDIFEKMNRNIFRRIPITDLDADETAASTSWAVTSTTD